MRGKKQLRKTVDEMKKTLQRLAEARGNDATPGSLTKMAESPPKGQPMKTAGNAQELKEPALKKTVTEKRGTKEINSNEVCIEDR